MPDSRTVEFQFEDGVLFISLNNPKFGNSFGIAESEQLNEILDHLNGHLAEPLKAVIWTSPHKSIFCSGGNLDYYAKLSKAQDGLNANERIANTLDRLATLPAPSLALVDGDCLGGGMELLSCFDFVMATPGASFGFWQRRLALSFGWGGGARWLKRLSEKKLSQLALEAKTLTTYEARHVGLIDQVIPSSELQRAAETWVSGITKWSQHPVDTLKNFTPEKERSAFQTLWLNDDHKKVLEKFLAKKP